MIYSDRKIATLFHGVQNVDVYFVIVTRLIHYTIRGSSQFKFSLLELISSFQHGGVD